MKYLKIGIKITNKNYIVIDKLHYKLMINKNKYPHVIIGGVGDNLYALAPTKLALKKFLENRKTMKHY